MSRPLRIEFEDAIYHVMNRGRNREVIFADDGDRHLFLSVLSETVKLFHIKIYAYCLMPNHYHVMIGTPNANISRAMRHINGVFTQKINKKHKKDGSLFRGRYKSILVGGPNYFKESVRYIHRHPLKAGLERAFGSYPWMSHRYYVSKNRRPVWICADEALSYFGTHERTAKEAYNDYVRQKVPVKFEKRLRGSNWPAVMGSDAFKEKIKRLALGKDLSEISSKALNESLSAQTMAEATDVFLAYFKMTREQYARKKGDYLTVRNFAVKYCREKLQYPNVEIAKAMNCSVETISRAYRSVKGDKAREYAQVLKVRERK